MALAGAGAALAGRVGAVRDDAFGERLGRYSDAVWTPTPGRPVIWLHAASVGELQGLRALLPPLRARFPGHAVVVSSQTGTGRALAGRLPEVDGAMYFPLDGPRIRRRALAHVQPCLFVFTETELWPGLLADCAARRIPCVLASGRLSERSLRRYRWVRPLMRRALGDVYCCMQTAADAERVQALGAAPERVAVTGSLKVEAPVDEGAREQADRALSRLGCEGRFLVIGASTHDGEESALLTAFARARACAPDLRLLLAPRHPERFASVAAMLDATGHAWARFTSLAEGGGRTDMWPAIILLDRMGVLRACFSRACVVFVGGTLAAVGGHNVLEPAVEGCAVLFGPHTEHVEHAAGALIAGGGAVRVADRDALAAVLESLLPDRDGLAAMGRRAAEVAAAQRGALARHLDIIAAVYSARDARETSDRRLALP
jgi:3-deoxy-D-manno-octulosonic-acid transferase